MWHGLLVDLIEHGLRLRLQSTSHNRSSVEPEDFTCLFLLISCLSQRVEIPVSSNASDWDLLRVPITVVQHPTKILLALLTPLLANAIPRKTRLHYFVRQVLFRPRFTVVTPPICDLCFACVALACLQLHLDALLIFTSYSSPVRERTIHFSSTII